MTTAILVVLVTGLLASTIALTLDIREHGARRIRVKEQRSRGVFSTTAVLATASIVAALAISGLDAASVIAISGLARVVETALVLALATIGGGPFAVLALRLATRGTSRAGVHGGILVSENEQQLAPPARQTQSGFSLFRRRSSTNGRTAGAADSALSPSQAMGSSSVEVLRGGTTIGLLERIAIAGAIVAGFPEAVAVVVAIKGVGRFSELAAPEAKERFIIGTLASFVWASACALVLR